ncbi:flavin reductase family protein [Bradyrhizobium sp. CSA112]|uniref:flavin reductase family protein n=1 Tax=Bradyrhizobium sp. CSA112 TaxID=2699170 RepID=UPI0023AF317E|nr:flavin reductase family protein [Bradyrhizobium sp. CSA112]
MRRSLKPSTSQQLPADRNGGACAQLWRPGPLKGTDRFVPEQWTTLATGAPTLKAAVGVLDCQLEEMIERFETIIAIGRIAAYLQAENVKPLVTFRGGYL